MSHLYFFFTFIHLLQDDEKKKKLPLKKVPSYSNSQSNVYEHSPNKPETSREHSMVKPSQEENGDVHEDNIHDEDMVLKGLEEPPVPVDVVEVLDESKKMDANLEEKLTEKYLGDLK